MADELANAVLRGALDEARALLAAGADPRAPSKAYPGNWAVHFDYGPAPLLQLATLTGNVPMVKLLLEHGVPVDEQTSQERSYQTHDDTYSVPGDCALTLAAKYGFVEVVRLLLEAGATVGLLDGEAATAARGYGHPELAVLLEAANAARPR